jgi:hypothetical protein
MRERFAFQEFAKSACFSMVFSASSKCDYPEVRDEPSVFINEGRLVFEENRKDTVFKFLPSQVYSFNAVICFIATGRDTKNREQNGVNHCPYFCHSLFPCLLPKNQRLLVLRVVSSIRRPPDAAPRHHA